MYYVYLLRSIPFPEQTYTGYTEDLRERMAEHNNGESKHTSKYKPWKLSSYHALTNAQHRNLSIISKRVLGKPLQANGFGITSQKLKGKHESPYLQTL
jgi:putative endonuclease